MFAQIILDVETEEPPVPRTHAAYSPYDASLLVVLSWFVNILHSCTQPISSWVVYIYIYILFVYIVEFPVPRLTRKALNTDTKAEIREHGLSFSMGARYLIEQYFPFQWVGSVNQQGREQHYLFVAFVCYISSSSI